MPCRLLELDGGGRTRLPCCGLVGSACSICRRVCPVSRYAITSHRAVDDRCSLGDVVPLIILDAEFWWAPKVGDDGRMSILGHPSHRYQPTAPPGTLPPTRPGLPHSGNNPIPADNTRSSCKVGPNTLADACPITRHALSRPVGSNCHGVCGVPVANHGWLDRLGAESLVVLLLQRRPGYRTAPWSPWSV